MVITGQYHQSQSRSANIDDPRRHGAGFGMCINKDLLIPDGTRPGLLSNRIPKPEKVRHCNVHRVRTMRRDGKRGFSGQHIVSEIQHLVCWTSLCKITYPTQLMKLYGPFGLR